MRAVGTLRDLVESLGHPALKLLTAPLGLAPETGELVVYEPGEERLLKPGDVVAAVGTPGDRELHRLLEAMGAAHAPALLLKRPRADDLVEVAARAGVALLAVPAAASWTQIILLVSSVLSRAGLGLGGDRAGSGGPDDLFAVANVIADMIDAPVTIEDPRSQVIAFSHRQEEADSGRTATILGRQVPERWLKRLRDLGVFDRLAREQGCLHVEVDRALLPRAIVAVRAGDEFLGSIWAAVRQPLSAERTRAFVNASSMVALHMLRHRLAADVEWSLDAELLAAVLAGGPVAGEATRQLGLTCPPFRVLAAGLAGEEAGTAPLLLRRCRSLLALHLTTPRTRVATAVVGHTLYGVADARDVGAVRQDAERVADRARSMLGTRVVIGIGPVAATIDALPQSRADADQVLRVLRGQPGRPVAELDDVRASALLLRFGDACGPELAELVAPLAALRAHDDAHGSGYAGTLACYLETFGSTEATARILGIHTNTVRHRLRRMKELGVDLDDPEQRLALMLQVRLSRTLAGGPRPAS
jgi:PucR C-terminal helix-turn-helix domain/GGDEF-like domain